jgi:nucleolar protein 15
VKKQKPTKDVASKKAAAPAEKAATKKSVLKKEKQSPKTKAATEKSKKGEEPEEDHEDDEVQSEAEQEEVDDDTKALVQALDSGDEDEAEAQVSTFKKGQDVGKVPKAKKSTKVPGSSSGTAGVMYLARIPHGFYEHELRSYFGQFGDITRLRVVRNKKTGASRHRAFIEFADAEVADIAARTMDKYLLFGHILSAKTVPPAQVHPDLFKGANRRFKVVPWNKMAGKQLERPLSETQWQAKISKEEKRRAARSDKLKEMGYDFEAPALKAAEAKPLLENGTGEEPKTIEAAAAETAEAKEEEEVAEAEVVEAKKSKSEGATPQKKKGKKGKKTKS